MRLLAVLLLLAGAGPAEAALTQRQLDTVGVHPAAGARLPAGLRFVDQRGSATTLGAVAGGRPLVLLFADYTCNHLCGPGLALTAGALSDSGLVAGRDYALAVVGIDPRDPVTAAQAMAAQLGAGTAVARGARLLTGSAASEAAAMRALGYRAVYDPASDQFAHDASVYVFAGDGRLNALLPELALRPASLRAAIAAHASAPESFAEQVAHLCYGLGAAHGRFGRPVVLALQGVTALLLVAGAGMLVRRRAA